NAGFGLDMRIIRQTAGQVVHVLLKREAPVPVVIELHKEAKLQLFTANYSITDYLRASETIIAKARDRASYGVSALAVHGLIESVKDKQFRNIVNKIDMVVPDGQ